MSKFLTAVFLIGFFMASQVHAGESPQYYRNIFIQLCEKLRQAGVEELGGMEIDQVISKSQQVKITLVPKVQYPGKLSDSFNVTRESAYYDPSANTIFISESHANAILANRGEEIFTKLIAHEFLRALGIDDENYAVSSLMDIYIKLSYPKDEPLRKKPSDKLLQSLEQKMNQKSLGGVTGVGGGGDILAMSFKSMLMKISLHALEDERLTEVQFWTVFNNISNFKIEVSQRQDIYLLPGQYLYDPESGSFIISSFVFSDKQKLTEILILFSSALFSNAREQ